MERFFKIIYYICLFFLIFFTIYLVTVLSVSPKNDAHKRGFIPCTEAFVLHASDCGRGALGCMAVGLGQDIKCNAGVVFSGLDLWIRGKQPTPWANYVFVPVSEAELDSETPYVGVVAHDVDVLENEHKFMEKHIRELENAKHRELQLHDAVLMSDDVNEPDLSDTDNIKETEEEAAATEDMNIDDEAFMDDFGSAEMKQENTQAPTSENDKTKALLKKNAEKSVEKKGEIND